MIHYQRLPKKDEGLVSFSFRKVWGILMYTELLNKLGLRKDLSGLLNKKVSKALIQHEPFPHLVVDDFLESRDFKLIQKHWPDPDLFDHGQSHDLQELPHIMQLGLPLFIKKMTSSQQKFWNYFFRHKLNEIISANLVPFMNNIYARYGKNLLKIEPASIMLMETRNQSIQMPIHSHYLKDPTNLFTILIYIDDDGRTDRGTTLYGLADVDTPTHENVTSLIKNVMNAEKGDMIPNVKELMGKKTIKFKENRLLTMIDSPYSFHGIGKCELGTPQQNRRIIRAHIRADVGLTSILYGLDLNSFIKRFQKTNMSPSSKALIHSDIRVHIDNPPLGSVPGNKEMAQSIECPNFDDYI